MAGWTINILPLAGGAAINTATPFSDAKITWALDGTGAAEIGLRASDVADGRWAFGQRRILIKNGAGVAKYQGWLDRLERGSGKLGGGSTKSPDWRVASRGLASHLDMRAVHGDFNQVGVTRTAAATALLAHIDAQTDDISNFTAGTITGTASTVDRYYCDGDVIADLFADLSEASPGGFAWEIDANGAFNAWVNGRGTDYTASKTIGPQNTMDWACVADTTELATYVTGLGSTSDGSGCGSALVVDFTAERTTYGRREVVITSDSSDVTEIDRTTTEELRARVASRINLRTSWIEGRGPWSFGTVWIGDTVKAQLGTEFGGDTNVRLINISIILEPGTNEFIECEWEAA